MNHASNTHLYCHILQDIICHTGGVSLPHCIMLVHQTPVTMQLLITTLWSLHFILVFTWHYWRVCWSATHPLLCSTTRQHLAVRT
jgi:hypothetical protein